MKRSTPRNRGISSTFTKRAEAFTRLDLAAAAAVSVLLFGVVVPLLAQGQARSQLAICLNNLRQAGRAVASWDADHGAADPWRVLAPEGTRNHPSGLQNNLWFQWAWMTNELRTPRILACPSDPLVVVASDFGFATSGGFLSPNYRNAGVSYFLGLDSRTDSPQSVLSGDRHLRVAPASGGCSSGVSPVYQLQPNTVWNSNTLHGAFGHILFHDGRVELKSNPTLQAALAPSRDDDNGAIHILVPRNDNQ